MGALRDEMENEMRNQVIWHWKTVFSGLRVSTFFQLRRQAAAHSDHIADVLEVQQTELSRIHARWNRLKKKSRKVSDSKALICRSLNEAVFAERSSFQKEMSKVLGRVGAIEQAVEERAEIHEVC